MSRVSVALLYFALLAATAYGTPQSTSDCFQYISCYACTNAPSGVCGWDPMAVACKPGSSSGPKGQTPWYQPWAWTTQQCCSTQTRCTDCFSNVENCGWDASSGTCQFGWSTGPMSGYSSSWVGQSGACPSQCEANYDCNSCSSASGCGWAADQQQCYAGNAFGPYSTPTVAYYSSSWYYSSCPSSGTWRLRWSLNSYPLWFIVGGAGFGLLVTSIAVRRRQRRVMMQQRRQQAYQSTFPAQPTVAAPLLLGNQGDSQGAFPGQPVYGQPPQTPYYGVAADTTVDVLPPQK